MVDIESGQPASVDTVKRQEYKKRGIQYGEVFIGGGKTDISVAKDSKTGHLLECLPIEDRNRVWEFSTGSVSLMPDAVFSDRGFFPTNRDALKALVATTYKSDIDAHTDFTTQEMYARALSALSADNLCFSNGAGATNTQEVLEDFFQEEFSRGNVVNFLARLTAQTMPVANSSTDRLAGYKENYDAFFESTRERIGRAMTVYGKYLDRIVPEKAGLADSLQRMVIYSNDILCLKIFTNDSLIAESKYGVLSAGAVTFDIDPISGLPLYVSKLPYNYDDVRKKSNMLPKDDPSYKQTLTVVHENVHNANSDRKVEGDWDSLVNELLTDSTAEIMVLESEGQPFLDTSDKYLAFHGYAQLVGVARDLVRNNFVTPEELIYYGLKQNPRGFADLIDTRIKECEDIDRVKNIYMKAMRRGLVFPRKAADWDEKVAEFHVAPIETLKKDFLAMWGMVESQFMGQHFYPLAIFDTLRERHPEIKEKDYQTMRQGEHQVLTDEAVEIFYDLFKKEGRRGYVSSLVDAGSLDSLVRQDPSLIDLYDLNIPDDLKIGQDEDDVKANLVVATGKILRTAISYKAEGWTEDQKLEVVLNSSVRIYEGVCRVLVGNWRDKGINFTRGDVLRLVGEVVPEWFQWFSGSEAVDDPSPVVDKILEGVDSMTRSIEIDGREEIPGPEQVIYWGQTLEFTK